MNNSNFEKEKQQHSPQLLDLPRQERFRRAQLEIDEVPRNMSDMHRMRRKRKIWEKWGIEGGR